MVRGWGPCLTVCAQIWLLTSLCDLGEVTASFSLSFLIGQMVLNTSAQCSCSDPARESTVVNSQRLINGSSHGGWVEVITFRGISTTCP